MATIRHGATTAKKVEAYEALTPMLTALFRDFQDLSKKKPDGVLNKSKISSVNNLLTDVFTVLDGEPTRTYLQLIDEDDVPQYSDVVILLGQTVAAMDAFHSKYSDRPDYGYGWAIKE